MHFRMLFQFIVESRIKIVDFVIANWALILVVLLSGGMLIGSAFRNGAVGGSGVTPAEAVLLINRQKAVVVDVSESSEYAAAHVGGARNVPLAELEQKLPSVVKNKALPVVLVCASGVRSKRAVAVARKLGYENAQSLSGGLRAWREVNLPIERA